MTRWLRVLFHWKFAFYQLLLPALRRLGPARFDAVLSRLGQVSAVLWPGRKRQFIRALETARAALDLEPSVTSLWPALASGSVRTLARDFSLEGQSDQKALDRFTVRGQGELQRALARGGGVILVGSHMGAYIPGLHWLFRCGIPIRALVQRPSHVSPTLSRFFDSAEGAFPQRGLFLQRNLTPCESIPLLTRARKALQSGHALYLCGDIPWQGSNTRPGRLLGVEQPYLAIWTDLAVLARVPVFHIFCSHRPDGRFHLEIDNVGRIQPGEESDAVADFLRQLEARIAANPEQAVAHLLWPCFHPDPNSDPARQPRGGATTRPSRRRAISGS